ncbi:MAG: extracellular solute-binding protein, partial [Treponema sp.]|nr:extracellular solute-binding protein [Treponema sp.]
MKKFNVSILTAILAAMALSPLWAGGNRQSGGGPLTLRFSYWGGDARIAIYNQIAQRYMEDNPDIRIALEPSSWNDYFNKLSTQVAGSAAPDVISMHPRYMNYYAS